MEKTINVAFVGNPNCGKTTLFNAYTGARLKVANWPGVTVEKKEGALKFHDHVYKLVDLPGIYSLTSYSIEEKLSRQYIMENDVDVIINVADASSLERNLYLTLQLIELGKPVILALNMMDIVVERGMEIDLHRLPEMLGIPVIPVSARKRTGLDILMHAVAHHIKGPVVSPSGHHHSSGHHVHDHHGECVMVYSDELEDKIDIISDRLRAKYPELTQLRWYAIKQLEMDEEIMTRYPLPPDNVLTRSYETDITNQKYNFIEEVVDETLVNKNKKAAITDRADRLLTDQWLGMPIFFGIMAIVFWLTFFVGDLLKGFFEIGLAYFSEGALRLLQPLDVNEVLVSLVVDGIIAGVGGILTFLPNIAILFLALAFLEDSGYMSRVAYVMDGLMGRLGLSGKAFIPMLLGFGCTVPAIMATRTLEDPRDRLRVILVTPFISCSARLPIYVLFSEMFFGKHAMLAAYSMYVIGLVVAVAAALVMHLFGEKKEGYALLIELPEYKTPNLRTIAIYVWEKIKDYLSRAGTTIFIASIVIWFILNFGSAGMVGDMSLSYGASLGKILAPVLKPAGLGSWQIALTLISGVAAKEVVVSSMAVLYGVGNIYSADGLRSMSALLGGIGFGAVNAYAMMVFCLLYVPCAATIGTVKKETESVKWTLFSIALQLMVAWVVAVLVYQVGSFIF